MKEGKIKEYKPQRKKEHNKGVVGTQKMSTKLRSTNKRVTDLTVQR